MKMASERTNKQFSTATTSQPSQSQQSLLKPKFRKPSSSSSIASMKVDKKPIAVGGKSTIETRHAKVVQKGKSVQQQQKGITGSRLNLLRALNKVKTEQNDNPESIDENGKKYIRSDEDCSDQSSYDGTIEAEPEQVDPIKTAPRKRKSPGSNVSSDSDLVKCLPPLPAELPPKIDYSQEEFLSLFGLVTPQVTEEIKAQKSKRKRRNCFKNEKNDFHYGNFDLNEVSRCILLSPHDSLTFFHFYQFCLIGRVSLTTLQ